MGIGGPALAFWLSRYGFSPTLIERAPAFRDGGYMIHVWGAGYDLVERMGLLDAARDRGYSIHRVAFVDEQGRPVSGFDADVFRSALSGRFFSIPRGDPARRIFDTVYVRVETLYSTSISAMREDTSGTTSNSPMDQRADSSSSSARMDCGHGCGNACSGPKSTSNTTSATTPPPSSRWAIRIETNGPMSALHGPGVRSVATRCATTARHFCSGSQRPARSGRCVVVAARRPPCELHRP